MIDWLRSLLGLCLHVWGPWVPVQASDESVVGRRRVCAICGAEQREFYPDGH